MPDVTVLSPSIGDLSNGDHRQDPSMLLDGQGRGNSGTFEAATASQPLADRRATS